MPTKNARTYSIRMPVLTILFPLLTKPAPLHTPSIAVIYCNLTPYLTQSVRQHILTMFY